ncbi:MAG: Uma2 family endonuclease, partial [Chitinophagia bacterium]|nr:Uma2 family endonuclease [Chitinophagia bacterium]
MASPAPAQQRAYITIQEYLEKEQKATTKSEYYRGEIFATAGAKENHNIVCRKLIFELQGRLVTGNCGAFGSDQRGYIENNELFTYPDVTIVCGKPVTLDNDDTNLLNPMVIVEVLSASTRSYD